MKTLHLTLSAALLFAGLAAPSMVRAEPLVLVTASRISLHDSNELARERDAVRYALPGGMQTIGADYDPDDGRFYLLARDAAAGVCALYFVDLDNAPDDGLAIVSRTLPTVPCSAQASELEFIRSDRFDAGLVISDGTVLRSYDSQDGQWDTVTVGNGNQTTPRILALALRGPQGASSREAVTGNGDGSGQLHDFTGNEDGSVATLRNPRTLRLVQDHVGRDASVTLPIGYDIGEDSGNRYLLAGGKVYAVAINGTVASLGDAQQGSLAFAVAPGGQAPIESDARTVQARDTAAPLRLATSSGRFQEARGATQPSFAPDRMQYPYGWVAFKIGGLTPGQSVRVTLTPQGMGPTPESYLKCPARGGDCYPFQGATFANGSLVITLTDGGYGDDDGLANGVIEDPGALALPATGEGAPAPVPTPGPPPVYVDPDPLSRGGALGALPLALLLLAAALRRGERPRHR